MRDGASTTVVKILSDVWINRPDLCDALFFKSCSGNVFVDPIPSLAFVGDAEERKRRLKDAAAEVIEQWEKYKKSLPKFAVEAIFDATEIKWPEVAVANSSVLGSAALGLGVGSGFAIALVSYAGVKIWRKYKEHVSTPYSYLNRISKLQSKSQSFLSLPPIA